MDPANHGFFITERDVNGEGANARLFREDVEGYGNEWTGFEEEDIGAVCHSCSWILQRKRERVVLTDGGQPAESGQATPQWYWYVVAKLEGDDSENIFHAQAPHRSGAKLDVKQRAEDAGETVDYWVRAYIPRAHFDCPECHGHECVRQLPNLRHDWDWECNRIDCSARFWGHPQDPEEVRT